MSGRPPRRGAWRLGLALAVTFALLGWLLTRVVEPAELGTALARLSAADLGRPLLLAAVAVLLAAQRWRTLLGGLGHPVPYRRCLRAVLATWPVAVVTPSRAGDALRAALVRDRAPLAAGLGSVLLEKLLDLQSLALLVLAGALAGGRVGLAALALVAVAGFWSALLLLPRTVFRGVGARLSGAARARLESAAGALEHLRRARGALVATVAMSLAAWGLSTAIFAGLLAGCGAPVPAADLLLVWPVAVVAAVLPFAFSGLGARDGVLLGLLAALRPGIDSGAVLAATLLYPALTSWLFAIVGTPLAMRAFAADPALRGWLGLRSARGGGEPGDEQLVDEQPVEQTQPRDGVVDGEREARRDGDPQVG